MGSESFWFGESESSSSKEAPVFGTLLNLAKYTSSKYICKEMSSWVLWTALARIAYVDCFKMELGGRLRKWSFMFVLARWNRELQNCAKSQMFQGLCKEHLQLATVMAFSLRTASATTDIESRSARSAFCLQHMQNFFFYFSFSFKNA